MWILRTSILFLPSLLTVRAQSTTPSTTISTLIDSSPDGIPTTLPTEMGSFFLPTTLTNFNMKNFEKWFYLSNDSLMIFSIHEGKDYPSYYNDPMYDIDASPVANLSLCIKTCAEYSKAHDADRGPMCTGVAYINGLCWRKNAISEDSTSVANVQAVSAILHFLNMASINWISA